MKDLKQSIIKRITKSGMSNADVVAILDEVRKLYHNRKNVGDKVLSSRKHSGSISAYSIITKAMMPVSSDKGFAYYKGAWKKIQSDKEGIFIIYLGNEIRIKFKKNVGK